MNNNEKFHDFHLFFRPVLSVVMFIGANLCLGMIVCECHRSIREVSRNEVCYEV